MTIISKTMPRRVYRRREKKYKNIENGDDKRTGE